MTNEQINIAIAEACGWEKEFYDYADIADYCNDLNAMHEAEKLVKEEQIVPYISALHEVVLGCPNSYDEEPSFWHNDVFDLCYTTARQRAEAFLRTMGKWEEASK